MNSDYFKDLERLLDSYSEEYVEVVEVGVGRKYVKIFPDKVRSSEELPPLIKKCTRRITL